MDENSFKKQYKPAACTLPPWANLIPKDKRDDVLRQIKQESIQYYGVNMDECPKRMVCLGKTCIGRPLPHNSPTAKSYIDQLKTTHKVVNNELFLSNCDMCPIKLKCTSTCAQVTDFVRRDQGNDVDLVFKPDLSNVVQETERSFKIESLLAKGTQIPWDVLNMKREQTVKKYLYEQKDFLTIAKELGYTDQKNAQYAFWAALTTLSEYASMRKFIEENKSKLNSYAELLLEDLYIKKLSITEVAKNRQVSKQSVQQKLARLIKKNNITWHVFVKKQGNKIVYNTAGILT